MEAPAHLTPPSRLAPPASSAAPLRTASLPPVSTLGPGSPGAGLALLPKRPHPRALSAAGLVLAAADLVALDLAGLAAPSGRMLMLLRAPVAAGLAVALAASLRAAGPAGALAGLILLLAGLVGGYLAAEAVQLRALTGATTVPAAHAALATAAGHWTLTAAALAGAVALALACIGRRRTGARPSPGRSRDPE